MKDVQGSDTFTVRWSKETLEAIHPVFLNRCEIDGLDAEEYVLTGDDLEPDTGGPLIIEQPTKITTKPLSPKDQDDRIRMIFGLTSNDPLPDVDDDTLESYHRHLVNTLVFPFQAECAAEYGHSERVKVIGLGGPDEEPMIDEEYGIPCEACLDGQVVTVPLGELDNVKGKPNRQLVDDYCYRETDDSWAKSHYWAPEVKEYSGKFYMTYSAMPKSADTPRLLIALAVSDDPAGPYEDLHAPWFDFGYSAIDGHIFVDDDSKPYLYFSRNGVQDGYSFGIIYGMALADDLSKPVGEAVKLLEADQPWEKVRYAENRCNEGAFVLKHNGRYYMTYSANHTGFPYLVELDNWDVSDRPGQPNVGGCWVWGYDEISWFAHQNEAYRNQWLGYAWNWVREHDRNGFFQMPGSRILHAPVGDQHWYYANTHSETVQQGFSQEETIKAIWSGNMNNKPAQQP